MLTFAYILFSHSSRLGVMCQSFFRCVAARVLLGGGKIGLGVGPLSRFPVPLRRGAFESARPKCAEFSAVRAYTVRGYTSPSRWPCDHFLHVSRTAARSEERRVGKECRSRW